MSFALFWEQIPDEIRSTVDRHRQVLKAIEQVVRQVPADDREALATATRALEEAGAELARAERHRFALSSRQMELTRWLMASRGMLVDAEIPTWPRLVEFGFADEEGYAIVLLHTPDDPRVVAYQSAIVALRDGAPRTDGIVWYKLSSSDHWLVTPIEIVGALTTLYRREGKLDPRETAFVIGDQIIEVPWWSAWLAYLAEAARHGGFRVR